MKRNMIKSMSLWIAFSCALMISPMVFGKSYTLRLATGFPPMHIMQKKVFEPWGKEIEKRSNGKVKIKIYPAGALGKMIDHYDLAEKGIADISYTLHDYTPGRFPATSVFSLPFMIPSAEKASTAMWKYYEANPAAKKEYARVKLLALFCHPGGNFHMVNKPILKMEDLSGMKIRSANPWVARALKALGAAPVTIPVTETYTALDRNVVDGTVLTWEGIGIFKLDDITRHTTYADFYTMVMMLTMNKRKWDSLPGDIKQVINDTTGLKMSIEAGKVYDDAEKPFRERALKKGVKEYTLSKTNLDKLEQNTLPMRKQWVKDMDSKGLPGEELLNSALQLLGKK